jgi:hypothetical protein
MPTGNNEVVSRLLAFRNEASTFAHTMPAAVAEISCADVVGLVLTTLRCIDRLKRKIDDATFDAAIVPLSSSSPPSYGEATRPSSYPATSGHVTRSAPCTDGSVTLYGDWPALPTPSRQNWSDIGGNETIIAPPVIRNQIQPVSPERLIVCCDSHELDSSESSAESSEQN